MATEAFVSGKGYATTGYVDQKVGSGGGITASSFNSSNGYIKYNNGLMVQWGKASGQYGNWNMRDIYFPQTFIRADSVIISGAAQHWDSTINYKLYNNRVWVDVLNNAGATRIDYIALGTWK